MLSLWIKDTSPVLEGDNLRLRLPRKSDYFAWQQIRRESAQHLKPFEPKWSNHDLTKATFEARVARTAKDAKSATEFSFFAFDTARNHEALLGGLTLSNIRYRAACHANLGYWLGVKQAGNGRMSAAVALVLQFAFETLNLRRVHAACLPDNKPSRRVLEKNGFAEEGYAEHYIQIDGKWRDHVLYGLTNQRFSSFSGHGAQ